MKNSIAAVLVFLAVPAFSQDLLAELDKQTPATPEYTTATFKGTRLINGQTIETKGAGALEFIFAHRFGPVSSGPYELYGLDQAFVRIGLEYGITSRLGLGIGRNSEDKTMDMYLRYKAIRQRSDGQGSPVTVTAFGIAAYKISPRKEDATFDIQAQDRLSYTGQAIIARKFSSAVSFQLVPTIVHKNTVDPTIEKNDQMLIGVGGRLKLTRSVALTSEYYYRFNVLPGNPYFNPVGVGVDIETGGHVFQLILTSTRGLTERAYLTETTGDISQGDIHFGFNITRTFQLKKQK